MSASTTAGARADQPNARSASHLMTVLGPFIGLVVVVVLFYILIGIQSAHDHMTPTFLTVTNMRIVATQSVIVGLGALGMTMIIISGGIDLSVGSVLALTSVLAAVVLQAGHSAVVAVIAAIALGGLVGAINGALITGLKVTPFIVTLGTLGIARGCASWLANEQAVNAPATWINDLAATFPNPQWLLVSPGVWLTLALAVVTAVILRYTRLGRYIFAIGSNEVASHLSGLRVDRLKIIIYTIAGLFFGLGGVLQLGRLGGQGDPTGEVGAELDIIAAVVIGGASLNGGEGSVLGSILGALIMALLRNGSQQMGWPAYTQQIIIGVVIIAAVALDRLRHRSPAK